MEIVTMLKYIMVAVPVCIALAGIMFLFQKSGNVLEVRLQKGIKTLAVRIPLILLATALYFCAFLGVKYIQNSTEASTVIGFNYTEASRGLNPNQTRFNSYDIISDEILNVVLERGGFQNLTVEELRSTLSVYPLEAGEEISAEQFYVSTEYVVEYKADFKTLFLNPREVVDLVAEVYNEQFQNEYERKTDALTVNFDAVDRAEYLDKPDVLSAMATNIQEYMSSCQSEDSSFRSNAGENFGGVAARAGNFKNVTLERLKAYILSNGTVDNKSQYIRRLNYANRLRNMSYRKNISSYTIRLEAIEKYERDMATIVLIPTRDEKGEFYMGRTKIGVDNFAEQAEKAMQTASSIQADIDTNNYMITQLINSPDLNRTEVDRLLESAQEELLGISESAKSILLEYDQSKSSNNLVITPQDRKFKDAYSLSLSIVLTVAFLFTYTFLLMSMPAKKKKEKKVSAKKSKAARAGGMKNEEV